MKFKELILLTTLSPIVFFFIVISRILRPFILLRVGIIRSSRLGHFSANTEVYLLNKIYNKKKRQIKTFDIWCFEKIISNKALEKIIRKKLLFGPNFILNYILKINKKLDSFSEYVIDHYPRDIDSLRSKAPIILNLSQDQKIQGKSELKKNFGISENDKFVTLVVRDKLYLNTTHKNYDWSYHDYRNCNIKNYLLAAEMLANSGFYVLRMGKYVEDKIDCKNKMIIDYANSKSRSDLLDVYIASKCSFCISSGTGFDLLPTQFRKPIVFTDQVPISIYPSYIPNSIGIFKQYYSSKKGRNLTLSEIFEKGSDNFLKTNQFKNAGIQLIDNTPQDILDVCLEMVKRLDKTWDEKKYDLKLQKAFWDKFLFRYRNLKFKGRAKHKKVVSRIGAKFISENLNLIN